MNDKTITSIVQLIKFRHAEGIKPAPKGKLKEQWDTLIARIVFNGKKYNTKEGIFTILQDSSNVSLVFAQVRVLSDDLSAVVTLNKKGNAARVLYIEKN